MKKLILQIPEYTEDGLIPYWEHGFDLITTDDNNQISIRANKAGLISLAIQLLTLAQDDVPIGHHFHYDEHNSLEKGSTEFVIEKI